MSEKLQNRRWVVNYQIFADMLYKLIMILTQIDFVVMIVSISMAVFGRYIFHVAPSWTEEIGTMTLVYMTFLTAALAIRDGRHIRMNIIDYIFSKKVCHILHFAAYLILLLLSIVLVKLGFDSICLSWIPRLPATHISMAFKYGIVFVCAIFNVFMAFSRLLKGEW